jgi:hypothetical protein
MNKCGDFGHLYGLILLQPVCENHSMYRVYNFSFFLPINTNKCETGTVVHTAFMLFLFFGPLFSVLSFLVQNSPWLVEEVLTLLCCFLNVGMESS